MSNIPESNEAKSEKWLYGSTITEEGIKPLQEEVMDSRDFYEQINKELDDYFDNDQTLQTVFSPKHMEEEEIRSAILQRLCIGWYNEIFIRDFGQLAVDIAPSSLKTQSALLRQVQDEHKHSIWIWNLLEKREIDPRDFGTTEEFRVMWTYLYGLCRKPENFLSAFASMQLVAERLVALKTIPQITAMSQEFDPEVAHLYGEKIHKDEIFHTMELPEFVITKHATTLDAQNRIRLGMKRGIILVDLMTTGVNKSRKEYVLKKNG